MFSNTEGHVLKYRRACYQMQKGMLSNTEGHVLKCRKACSQIQKGMFSNTEGHVLKYRKACSQIQKGPFFCLNTHASCSCGAKQIYIKIKYSSPHMPSILPTHFPSSPNPPPSHPHPTHLPFPSHSPSAPIPLPFCPQPALFPSPAHSPLSVTHRTCSSVTLSPLATNLFTRSPVNSSTYNVTHRTCSSVTLSSTTSNMFPSPLVPLSSYPVNTIYYSLIPPLLVNYFYHITFLSVLVQNTATLILPFLSPTSTVKNITINNTSH